MGVLTGLLLTQFVWAQQVRVVSSPIQLTGAPLVVDLEVHNEGERTIRFPDLAARPDLVRFELRYGGKRERRYNTPLESAPTAQWALGPGDQRELRLEVPGSAGIAPGLVTVAVSLHNTQPPTPLPALKVRLQAPMPGAGDLSGASAAPGTRHQDVAWVHEDGEDAHLVLHHASGTRGYELVLTAVPGRVQPWLSHSRLDTLGERSIVWQVSPQRIEVVRLRGQRTRGPPRAFDLPWPRVEIAGQPITELSGHLRVPIWIPAPAGPGGELRLLTLNEPRGPSFQRLAQLPARPVQVLGTVDPTGTGLFLVVRPDAVDIYTPPASPDLPWIRRPMWRTQDDAEAVQVALGSLPAGAVHAGGTAVLLATRTQESISTQWLSMRGTALEAPSLTEDLGRLVQLVPRGVDWPGLVFRDGAETTLCVGAAVQPLSGPGHLIPAAGGGLAWRTLTQDGPINDRPIVLGD